MNTAEMYIMMKRINNASKEGGMVLLNRERFVIRGIAPAVPIIKPAMVYRNNSINMIAIILIFEAPTSLYITYCLLFSRRKYANRDIMLITPAITAAR